MSVTTAKILRGVHHRHHRGSVALWRARGRSSSAGILVSQGRGHPRASAYHGDGNDFGDFGDWGLPEPDPVEGSEGRKQEEIIHIFTQELEVVTFGPKRPQLLGSEELGSNIISGEGQQDLGASPEQNIAPLDGRMPTVEEQGLCIGATFGIKAFNAVDPSRQISVLGFCRCVHTLGWHVNRAVLTKGGVVTMKNHHVSMEKMEEKLTMSIQVPFLFGVPQEWDAISEAISTGGGLIDRVSQKWLLY
uniref:DUF7811 domain-containing protein n=1 Tax=Chloropicon primus TaxID=1764295 RepID=A0A7S2WX58_9CHLO|mmetsp:Transcript_12052/g.33377  ORF Transcript_12052/g.33377 Transcript_12052/m.33377 type:complete len:247 (+) Transcript_12052:320-1060(+)